MNESVIRWLPQARKYSEKYGVPVPVILAFIHIESSGNPRAKSVSGARGLMQLMPRFFVKAGEQPEVLYDPDINIQRGTAFAASLKKKWGTWTRAAAAYFGQLDASGNVKTDTNNPSRLSGVAYVFKFWRAYNLYKTQA